MRAVARNCLTVLLVGGTSIAISILYLDRPLAEWAAAHELHLRGGTLLTGLPGAALPAALAVPVIGALAMSRFRTSQLWSLSTRLAISVMWTAATIELILKWVFGRLPPVAWVQGHTFGFHWFGGNDPQFRSFPSGEAGLTMAVISVLWLNYPRLRLLLALAAGLEAFLLVDFHWHFLGDILAGGVVGTFGGLVAQHGGLTTGTRERPAEIPANTVKPYAHS